MRSIVTFEGIDEAIENLRYNNERSLKYKLIDTIRKQYDLATSVDSITEIDTDFLVKTLWETGDNLSLTRNRRKNYNSIKSSVNSDLKDLYSEGLNRQGIIIGPKNIFDMSEEAKSEMLESFSYGSGDGNTQIPLDKITDVLNVINTFISNSESGIEDNEKFEQLKEIIKDISGKVGVTVVSQGDPGSGVQFSQNIDASVNGLYQKENVDSERWEKEGIADEGNGMNIPGMLEDDFPDDLEENLEDEEVDVEDVPEEEIEVVLEEAEDGIPEELEDEAVDELEEVPEEELEEPFEDDVAEDLEEAAEDEEYEEIEDEDVPEEELEELPEGMEEDLEDETGDAEYEEIEVDEIPEDEIEEVLDEAVEDVPEELEAETIDELEEIPEEELEEPPEEVEGDSEEEADDEEYEEVDVDEIPEDEIDEVLDEAEDILEESEDEAVDELEEIPEEELEESLEEVEGDPAEEATC